MPKMVGGDIMSTSHVVLDYWLVVTLVVFRTPQQ